MIRALWPRAARRERRAATGRVSVVIPLYNHARFITEAVASALAQGPLLREVIVVDDGSTDGSAAVMQALSETDERIVFWSQPNRGAHAAINAGLHRATGELLAILNSDDVYAPDRLARLAAALDADPGAGLAASGLRFIDGSGAAQPNPWHTAALATLRESGDAGLALVNGNFLMTTSNYVIPRQVVDQVGYFAPLRYAHDLDFALRLVAEGRRIVMLDDALLSYRTHGGNTIAEDHAKVRLEWAIVAAFFLTSLWDRPDSPEIDWKRAVAIEQVLDKHALARAVHLCRAYLRRHPASTLERSPILSDLAFRELVTGCL